MESEFFRADNLYSEFNSWTLVPKGQTGVNLSFFGDLLFDRPLGSSKSFNINTLHKWDNF